MAVRDIELSSAAVCEFIDLWEAHPSLWNPCDRGYKNKAARRQAYSTIAEAMDIGWSDEQVKRKLESLRAQYNRCVKDQERRGQEGHPYRPGWVHYDRIRSFLRPSESEEHDDKSLTINDNSMCGGEEMETYYVEMDTAEDHLYHQNEPYREHNSSSPTQDANLLVTFADSSKQPKVKTEVRDQSNVPLTNPQVLSQAVTQPVCVSQPVPVGQPVFVNSSNPQFKLLLHNLPTTTQPASVSSALQSKPRTLLPGVSLLNSNNHSSAKTSVNPQLQQRKPFAGSRSFAPQHRQVFPRRKRTVFPTVTESEPVFRKRKTEESRPPLIVKVEEPPMSEPVNVYANDEKGGHAYRNYGLSVGDRLNELKDRKVILDVMEKIDAALLEGERRALDLEAEREREKEREKERERMKETQGV